MKNTIKIVDNINIKENSKFVIYLIRNLINSKIYIGQTNNLTNRLWKHVNCKNSKQYITNSIKKYGFKNFECEILHFAETFEEMNTLEAFYIEKYESTNREIGYNIRKGGQNSPCAESTKIKLKNINSGKKLTEEIKNKIKNSTSGTLNHFFGKKHTEDTKLKMSEAWEKRKPISEETRNKMSESQTGRKHSNETKEKMRAIRLGKRNKQTSVFLIDINLNLVNQFNNIPECADFLQLNKRTIYSALDRLNLVKKRFYILKKESFDNDLEKIRQNKL